MSQETVLNVVFFVVFLLFSGVIHELCHALAADHFGDPTPRLDNRLTLNPVPHIDPVWTILMPMMFLLFSGGTFAFGGAKPVSMNPARFRHPERDFTIAAAVGPLSNFLLAGVVLGITALLPIAWLDKYVLQALYIFFLVNIYLGLFNMIPIPPLDGSRVVRYFLSPKLKEQYDRLSGIGGMIIIIVLAFTGVVHMVLGPFVRFLNDLFYSVL